MSLQREVEATPWGGLLLGNVWPAYIFALPLGARIWAVLGAPHGQTLHAHAELLQDAVTIVFLALVVVLFAIRRRQIRGRHASLAPGAVALAGTFLLSAAAYLPIDPTAATTTLLAASAVVVCGTLFAIWSLATLGRCFGLFPEVRGLVLSGPYRLVRHPVYLGELVSAAGLLLARPHPLVLAVLAVFVVLQYWRTVFEERAMSAAYPGEYPAYAGRVPRFVPGWHGDPPWLCVAAAALIVLCALPFVVATVAGPADLARVGTFWFSQDFSQYAAAMREGAAEPGWLIHDHFSAEPHSAAFIYPLYVGIGKLAGLLGLSRLTLFAAVEWLGRLAVLGSAYVFAATFIAAHRPRHLAVLLTLGALGLDAWAAALAVLLRAAGFDAIASVLPDRINPYLELSSFGVLLSAPHLMLGLALTLVCAPIYLRAAGSGQWRWLAGLGAAVVGLSLVHAFNVPVLVSVIVAHAALTGRRAWPAASVACLAAAPMTLYSLRLFQADPFWSGTYGAQNSMPAPAPWALPIDLGLVLLAAPLAWRAVRAWPPERRRLICLWVGLGLLWMYVPVPYQRRFAFGVQPALAVLAGVGLVELNAWLRMHRVGGVGRRLVNFSLAAAATSTSVLVYASLLGSAVTNQPAEVYLWTRSEAAAGDWLGSHSTAQDVVLASTGFANPLVGVIDGRVVHGHIVATLDSPRKAAQVARFYAADAPPAERTQLLRATGATLVALGPQERALGATELASQPDLELIYDRDGVELFRVR